MPHIIRGENTVMPDCECMKRPDAVDKKNWLCIHGNNLKKAHEERQKKSAEHYANQAKLEAKARAAATDAFNKIFSDTMKGVDQH